MKKTGVARIGLLTVTLIGALSLAIVVVLSICVGSTSIPVLDVIKSFLAAFGFIERESVELSVYMSVIALRLPRILCGALAGGGLAISGTIMQGVFRNPLADPGLLGVSTGAGFGALIAIVLSLSYSFFSLPAAAFAGSLAAVAIIFGVSFAARGSMSTVTLVMSGMAVSALFSAFTSLLLTLSNEYQVNKYIFWTMGGLSNRRWEHVYTMLVPVMVCTVILLLLAGRLDVMMLGDEQALALGVDSGKNRVVMIILASLCTASVVCVTGPIGFVGLMIPHILRLILGPSHRRLCISSFFFGGVFLTVCDTLVRWISGFYFREFSVGIVTALIGAPYFLFLLIKKRSSF